MVCAISTRAYCAPSQLLDALRYEESGNDAHAVNINRDGTFDLGWYQFNTASIEDFRWRYNGGKLIDPCDKIVARRIADAHLDALYRAIGDRLRIQSSDCGVTAQRIKTLWHGVIVAWNCGLTASWLCAPKISYALADRVIKRAINGEMR